MKNIVSVSAYVCETLWVDRVGLEPNQLVMMMMMMMMMTTMMTTMMMMMMDDG